MTLSTSALFLWLSFACLLWQCCLASESDSFVDSPAYKLVESHAVVPSSVRKWNFIHESKKFSVTTMHIDHHSDGSWYIPSLHEKYSAGWNRTVSSGFLLRPYSCNIRFYAIGLASTLENFVDGGTGYLIISKLNDKFVWHGIDGKNNETAKIHCYYHVSKGYGSNFEVSFRSANFTVSFIMDCRTIRKHMALSYIVRY